MEPGRSSGRGLCVKILLIRLAAVVAILLLAAGCSTPPDAPAVTGADLPEIVQDGISIPRFPTAADQLNYAKSGLTEKKRKMAALRAVHALYPGNRLECGHAALGLAYLHLEPQYRFASESQIQRAANDFQAVARDFSDLPEILSKALWYLGWIHTDLKGDADTGMAFYWKIVDTLAHIPMNLRPTAPWVNLVYSTRPAPKALKPVVPKRYWAQVALLEIVRNSPDRDRTTAAFYLLMNRYPSSRSAGLALKAMLADPKLAPHALPASKAYLARSPLNPYLAKDIQALAEAASP